MTARLRGLLLGHGHMGRLHRSKLENHPDVGAVTVIDPAQGLEGPLEGDFAIVATPTPTHVSVVQPLLERAIPCLVEKPLAGSVAEATAIADHPLLSVGHVERFNPALGALDAVTPQFVQADRLGAFTGRSMDIDVVADLMVHDLDLVLAWMGPEVREVRACGVGVLGGMPDIVNARIELERGVAVLTASRVSRQAVRTLRLVDERYYWSVDLTTPHVTRVPWGQGELAPEEVSVPPGDALERQLSAFLRAVQGAAPFPVSGATALSTLQLVEAVQDEVQKVAARLRTNPGA